MKSINEKAHNIIIIAGIIDAMPFSFGTYSFDKYPPVLIVVMIPMSLMVVTVVECIKSSKIYKHTTPIGHGHFISEQVGYTDRFYEYMKHDHTDEIIMSHLETIRRADHDAEMIAVKVTRARRVFLAGISSSLLLPITLLLQV